MYGYSGTLFQYTADTGNNPLLKHPSATLTPGEAVCSGMITFCALHHPRNCSPRARSLVDRTVDVVTQIGVRDRTGVIRAVCLGASQPSERIITHTALSECVVQSEPQPVSLVCHVSLCHFLDKLFYKFGCLLFREFGVRILPAHRDNFGIPDVIGLGYSENFGYGPTRTEMQISKRFQKSHFLCRPFSGCL